MLQKLLFAGFAITSSALFAGHTHHNNTYDKDAAIAHYPHHEFLTAPYIGASIGLQNNFAGGVTNFARTASAPAVYQGIGGTLSAGYATVFQNRWYLAGEIFGSDNAKARNFRLSGYYGVQSNWSYGIDVIPGVIFTDSLLLYLRAGGLGTNFNNIGINRGGWQLGGGSQVNLTRNWDFRIEYIFSAYHSVRSTIVNKIGANQFNAGVVYKFV